MDPPWRGSTGSSPATRSRYRSAVAFYCAVLMAGVLHRPRSMKRIFLAGILAVALGTAGCDAGGGEATPTLDRLRSGAPLNPGGVEPEETMSEIEP